MMNRKTGVATGGFSVLGAILPLLEAFPEPVATLLPTNDAAASVVGATILGAIPPVAKWLWDLLGKIHERRILGLEARASQAEADRDDAENQAETIRVREIRQLQTQVLMLGRTMNESFKEVRDRQESAVHTWSQLLQESRHDTNEAVARALAKHDARVLETHTTGVRLIERFDHLARQQQENQDSLREWSGRHDARQEQIMRDIEALKEDVRTLSDASGNRRRLAIDRRRATPFTDEPPP